MNCLKQFDFMCVQVLLFFKMWCDSAFKSLKIILDMWRLACCLHGRQKMQLQEVLQNWKFVDDLWIYRDCTFTNIQIIGLIVKVSGRTVKICVEILLLYVSHAYKDDLGDVQIGSLAELEDPKDHWEYLWIEEKRLMVLKFIEGTCRFEKKSCTKKCEENVRRCKKNG